MPAHPEPQIAKDFLERGLDCVARSVVRRPRTWLIAYSALALVSALVAIKWLDFETDQNELISNDLDYNRRYLAYLDEFGDQEPMFCCIDARRSLSRAMEAADAVAAEMEPLRQAGVVRGVVHRLDTSAFERGALLLLGPEVLEKLTEAGRKYREEIRELLYVDRGLAGWLRFGLDRSGTLAAADPGWAGLGFTLLGHVVAGMEAAVDGAAADGPSSWLGDLAGSQGPGSLSGSPAGEYVDPALVRRALGRGYLYTGDLLLVLVKPDKDYTTLEVIREPLRSVRAALDRVRDRFPDLDIGLTGRPVLQADEMETTNADMTRAAVLALAGVLVLFMLFFRAVRRPILTAVVLVIAIALTFGVATLTVGHLNLLSIVFAIMLVSLGTDFGVHVIARYQEALGRSVPIEEALREAIVKSGRANITGATTTAAAFYTALLVDFRGLAELGWIAGTGVLICMLAMNSLLPALLLLTDRRRLPRSLAPIRLGFLVAFVRRPAITIAFLVVPVLLALPLLRRVSFDSNLLELQAPDLPSVQWERRITDSEGVKTWFAVYLAESLDEVRRLVGELGREELSGVIGGVESVLDFVPDAQDGALAEVARLREAFAGDSLEEPGVSRREIPFDLGELEGALEALLDRVDDLQSAAARRDDVPQQALAALKDLTDRLDGLVEKMNADRDRAAERLAGYQKTVVAELRGLVGGALALLKPEALRFEDLDPFLRGRLRSPESGRYIVYAYPKEDIWKPGNMEAFIEATRAVDSGVTGVPEQVFSSTTLMKRGFALSAVYALVAVFVLILLDFRRLSHTLLAMLPIGFGIVLACELMPLLGMSLNLANFFAVPIVIGTGINGGVHLVHRFLEERPKGSRRGALATTSTMTAVVLSELTTIVALGMLLQANHRGVASLGGMMVLGCSACLLASVLVLPAILELVERRAAATAKPVDEPPDEPEELEAVKTPVRLTPVEEVRVAETLSEVKEKVPEL